MYTVYNSNNILQTQSLRCIWTSHRLPIHIVSLGCHNHPSHLASHYRHRSQNTSASRAEAPDLG